MHEKPDRYPRSIYVADEGKREDRRVTYIHFRETGECHYSNCRFFYVLNPVECNRIGGNGICDQYSKGCYCKHSNSEMDVVGRKPKAGTAAMMREMPAEVRRSERTNKGRWCSTRYINETVYDDMLIEDVPRD